MLRIKRFSETTSTRTARTLAFGLSVVAAVALVMVVLLASGSRAGAQTGGATTYTVTDLGTLDGSPSSGAEAINESGQVVGWSGYEPDAGDTRAFLWQNGSMSPLGTLGGDYSHAYDINDSGQVVGESDYPIGPEGNGPTKAFLWQNGHMKDLGSLLGPPEEESHAYAINDSGQVVGESKTFHPELGFPDHAFLYSGGEMQDLGILGPQDSPGYSVAYDISGLGQVVGEADLQDFMGTHAFLSNNGGPMSDLGTLGGNYSVAYDINDAGQVVGESSGSAFIWENGAMTPMSNFEPAAINNAGQVVGETFVDDPDCTGEVCGGNVAAVWQNGEPKNLNDLIDPNSGWILNEATDINDEGQIVGRGSINGEDHAFLLTPPNSGTEDTTPPTTSATPDDSEWHRDGTVTISAADGKSGVKEITYSATGAQVIETTTVPGSSVTVEITTEGETTITYSATDNAGNTAAEKTVTIKVRAGGYVSGTVTDLLEPVAGAPVQVCLTEGGPCAWTGRTDSQGNYQATGLPSGHYDVTAYPPAASTALIPATIGSLDVTSNNDLEGQDIQLRGAQPPPPGTVITPSGRGDGIPIIYWRDALELTTKGCPGGSASYEMVQNTRLLKSGRMEEGPTGIYAATVTPFYPFSGYSKVTIKIDCPEGTPDETIEFNIYIDPSGFVKTTEGDPIEGATVTLYRSDDPSGPFVQVPDGSDVMSPINRDNPDTTDAAGHFGWDVIAGYYKVRAEKQGCTDPNDPNRTYVESRVMEIPPPVTDLDLRLDCPKLDTTPPDVTIITPADGAEYKLGEAVTADYSCSDGESGIDSCAGPVPSGGSMDTSSVGQKTFTVEARDGAGNTATVSHGYSVVYDFKGFFSPVNNPDTLNVAKAGSAIPMKFSLSGDRGLDIFATASDGTSYPKSGPMACDSAAAGDAIEQTVTANTSGLTYEPDLDQYNYVWKTKKEWVGTCRQFVMELDDGEEYQANFKFR